MISIMEESMRKADQPATILTNALLGASQSAGKVVPHRLALVPDRADTSGATVNTLEVKSRNMGESQNEVEEKKAEIITGKPIETEDEIELESLEVRLLLEGIYKRFGFDFRQYSPASFRRRLWKCMHSENLTTISSLQDRIFHDPAAWKRFLASVTVNVTSMFRDPEFYRSFRTIVVPLLEQQSFIRIWHAGCASGEEVYSTAILLKESGLLDRCRIYATDVNEAVLARARNGIYRIESTASYNENYKLAGGLGEFSDYYQERYGHCIMDSAIREKILFAKHDLVTDGSFNDFNVILCRNVLIYFSKSLQEQVHQMLYKSLTAGGILGLGERESLRHTEVEECYRPVAEAQRLYQRTS